jgi:energy-coupling factor transporter ATP-binding protein EcfA2
VSRALRFRALRVRRMPGFPGGGPRLEELSPGINLIHGPNASGKTTTALALQSLLWPQTAPPTAGVDGRFQLGDASWTIDVDTRRAVWQRDGQEAPAPPLPPADDRDRYLLSLHGLLRDDDRSLAERVRVESAGGYDLRAAAESLRFGAGGRPAALLSRLAEARDALDRAREAEARLRDEATLLERLRERRRAVSYTAARLEPLQRAHEHAVARDAEDAARRVVEAYPAGVSRLRGDELDRLAEWDRTRAACERVVAEAEAEAGHARAALERAGLGEAGVGVAVLTELEVRLDALRRLDDDLARARDLLAQARGRRLSAGSALGGDTVASTAPTAAMVGADRLERWIRQASEMRERRAALDERIRVLAGAADRGAADPDASAEAVRLLRAWLRAGSGASAPDRRLRLLLLVAVLALGVVGVVAAVVGSPLVKGAGVGVLLLAALLLVFRPGRDADARTQLQRQAERLGHGPGSWTADGVERALDDLEQQAAAARLAAERHAEAGRLAAQLATLEAEEVALETERRALASELGMAPAPEDLKLHVVAGLLRDLEEARSAEAAAAETVRALEARQAAEVAAAAGRLAPFGYEVADAASVAGALSELRARRETHQAAVAALATAAAERGRASTERDDAATKRAALFAGIGVAEDQEHVLRGWIDLFGEYRHAVSELELATRTRAAAAAALVGLDLAPGADLANAPVAELAVERAAAAAAAEEERELATRIAGIVAVLERARQKHDVEDALARVGEAEAELAARRDEDVEAEFGAVLVAWLGEQAADYNRPAVFHRARDLFRRITRGRYRLDLEEGDDAAFRAYDTTTHRGHALDELSSGTRLQLLLAVRLAFVETQETGAALPLLLDEVLANCDDERATAIIDAALAIARDGRQIFYFTAQPDELAKWRARLEEQADVEWCVRGVLDGAGGGAPALAPNWTLRASDPVPAPGDMDHSAYGRTLRVPPFDPWADGVGGVHLWYLVDDMDALHQLLTMGITRWGQLDALAAAGGPDALPGGMRGVVDRARHTAALCDRFRLLWRQGRGRPVDRAVLAESGAISDTFMDRVAELCDELGGHGDALVETLQQGGIPRFRSAQADELRAFLLERGHIAETEPLEPEQLRIILAADAGGLPAADAILSRLAGPARVQGQTLS